MSGTGSSSVVSRELARLGAKVKPRLGRLREQALRARLNATTNVEHQSSAANLYHCCVQKTASQWVRAILSDKQTFKYSGLHPYQYFAHLPGGFDPRDYYAKQFPDAFPSGTIATPFYTGFDAFAAMPKPATYTGFFVSRDPRDIVVSNYFSTRYSHGLNPTIVEAREELHEKETEEGLLATIERLQKNGLFDAMRSWIDADQRDENVLLIRYEDLVDDTTSRGEFDRLFAACDIAMPETLVDDLLSRHSFEKLSGRGKGQTDVNSHYRQGLAGDWMNHFTAAVESRTDELCHDLIEAFGV